MLRCSSENLQTSPHLSCHSVNAPAQPASLHMDVKQKVDLPCQQNAHTHRDITVSLFLISAQPGMINKRTTRGETALLLAVSSIQLRCIQVLLERGADADISSHERETPLYKGTTDRKWGQCHLVNLHPTLSLMKKETVSVIKLWTLTGAVDRDHL